jgi:hypothetical protein
MRTITLSLIFSLLSITLNAQMKGDVMLLDSTPQYNTAPASSFAEFGEYMSCVDSNNRISILSIENYELFLFESNDSGATWAKSQIVTGDEGDFYCAFITTTPGGQRVILYGINSYYNYGSTISTSAYFRHSTYAMVEESPGNWKRHILAPPTNTNNGLLPFGIFVDGDGNVRAYLHQRGWYTYGGYVHEMIFNTSTKTWGNNNRIISYAQRIDRGTAWYASVGEDDKGDIFLIFRKQTNNASVSELVLWKQVNGSWTNATNQVLDADYPSSYWGWDISTDDEGHFYFMHTEAAGPQGPRITLARDEFTGTEIYPFTSTDTLSAATFIDVDGREPIILFYFKNVGKKFYEFDGTTLTEIPGPKFDAPGDSTIYHDYMWVHWSMASTANFGTLPFTINYIKEGQGRDPITNAVLEMPFRLIRTWPYEYDTVAKIYYFSLPGMVSSTVDTVNQQIDVVMPVGTDVSNIAPDSILTTSTAIRVSPGVGEAQDFTSPVQYEVFAEDGVNSFTYTAQVSFNVGVEKHIGKEIKIYPNPTNGLLHVELPKAIAEMELRVEIYNTIGKKVYTQRLADGTSFIDLTDVPAGVYYVKLFNGKMEVKRKIVKM